MKQIKQKLNSQCGASLMITLIFFLVCVMIASVTLTAASASVGRTVQQRKEQQAYLSVSSAAQLLQSSFQSAGMSVTAERIALTHQCNRNLSQHTEKPASDWQDTTQVTEGDDMAWLRGYLRSDALLLSKTPDAATPTHTFTIKPDNADMLAVQVKMTMEKDYKLIFDLAAVDPNQAGKTLTAYTMEVAFTGTATEESASANDTTATCQYITTETVIDDTGSFTEVEKTVTTPLLRTTTTRTISWQAGVITKGAIS